MIRKGDIVNIASNHVGGQDFVVVDRIWDKRDIDPECPQSVAIVGMVTFTYISGNHVGVQQSLRRAHFSRKMKIAKFSSCLDEKNA